MPETGGGGGAGVRSRARERGEHWRLAFIGGMENAQRSLPLSAKIAVIEEAQTWIKTFLNLIIIVSIEQN